MANQALAGKLNASLGEDQNHSIQKVELNPSKRIHEVIGEESVASFSRRCGIGDSTIRKYLNGALPNSSNIVAIADTANVNIEWLASGRGPKLRGESQSTNDSRKPPTMVAYSRMVEGIPAAPPIQPSVFHIDDMKRLTLAIEAVEEGLASIYDSIPTDKRAKLIAAAYDLLIDMDQKDNVIKFIKLAA